MRLSCCPPVPAWRRWLFRIVDVPAAAARAGPIRSELVALPETYVNLGP
jgi:hypothetical protein